MDDEAWQAVQAHAYDFAGPQVPDDGGGPDDYLTPDEMDELLAAAAELDALGIGDEGSYGEQINGYPVGLGQAMSDPGFDPAHDEHDAAVRATAFGLAQEFAESGNLAEAAEICQEAGFAGVELNGQFTSAYELAQEATSREQMRVLEDEMPLARNSEDRMEHLAGRLSRHTYRPEGPYRRALEFTSADTARPGFGRMTGRLTCSNSDDLGYCTATTHQAGCGSAATTEVAEALQDAGHLTMAAGTGEAFIELSNAPDPDPGQDYLPDVSALAAYMGLG